MEPSKDDEPDNLAHDEYLVEQNSVNLGELHVKDSGTAEEVNLDPFSREP